MNSSRRYTDTLSEMIPLTSPSLLPPSLSLCVCSSQCCGCFYRRITCETWVFSLAIKSSCGKGFWAWQRDSEKSEGAKIRCSIAMHSTTVPVFWFRSARWRAKFDAGGLTSLRLESPLSRLISAKLWATGRTRMTTLLCLQCRCGFPPLRWLFSKVFQPHWFGRKTCTTRLTKAITSMASDYLKYRSVDRCSAWKTNIEMSYSLDFSGSIPC